MSGVEKPPKVARPATESDPPLTPEQKGEVADQGLAEMTKFLERALAVKKPDPASAATENAGDDAQVARTVREKQIRKLIDDYGELPELTALLDKVEDGNADVAIQTIEEKLRTGTPTVSGDTSLGQVNPVKRSVGQGENPAPSEPVTPVTTATEVMYDHPPRPVGKPAGDATTKSDNPLDRPASKVARRRQGPKEPKPAKVKKDTGGTLPVVPDTGAPAAAAEQSSGVEDDTVEPTTVENKARKFSSVQEAIDSAPQRFPKAEVMSDAENIDFREIPESSNDKPARFVPRGPREDEIQDIGIPEQASNDKSNPAVQSSEEQAALHAEPVVKTPDVSAEPPKANTPEDFPAPKADNAPASQREVESNEWTEARLLTEFPEEAQFVLQSRRGRSQRTYQRLGDGFVHIEKGKNVTPKEVLELLNKNGWTLEEELVGPQLPDGLKKTEDMPVLTDEVGPVPKQKSPEQKKGTFQVLQDGETARYLAGDNKVYGVTKVKEGYKFTEGTVFRTHTEAEMREIVERGGWTLRTVERIKTILADGQSAQYFVPELRDKYTLTKTAEGYTFTDGKNYTSPVYTEAEMAKIIRTAGWRRVQEQYADNGKEQEHPVEEYAELFEGDIWVKYDETGEVVSRREIEFMEEVAGQKLVDVNLDDAGRLSETVGLDMEQFREELHAGGYVRAKQGERSERTLVAAPETQPKEEPAAASPEASKAEGAPKNAEAPKEEEKTPEQKIEDLRDLVAMQRLEYVSVDHKQNSAWMKVKRFFGKSIGDQPGDADTESKRQSYELALMKLQEAELAELKKGNLSDVELREKMAGMLNFYKYEERINLFKTRDEVKIETMNLGHLVVTALETAGRSYNKLPRSAKYAIGALCIATAAAGGSIGGGVAAAALGMASVRKALAAAGLAVTADTYLEGKLEKKREAAAKEEQSADIAALKKSQEAGEDRFAKLDALLKKDISGLDAKFRAQKKEALLRRSAAWGVSVGGVLGGSFLASHWQDIKDALKGAPIAKLSEGVAELEKFRDAVPAPVAAPPVEASSVEGRPLLDKNEVVRILERKAEIDKLLAEASRYDGMTGEKLPTEPTVKLNTRGIGALLQERDELAKKITGASQYDGKTGEPLSRTLESSATDSGSTGESVETPVSLRTESFRQNYVVTAEDGKRGFWGVLDKRLPEGFTGNRNGAIANLQRIIGEKLAGKSPAELKELGFGPKGIGDIRPGDTIALDKLLTEEEIRSALDGKTVAAVTSEVAEETEKVAARAAEASPSTPETVRVTSVSGAPVHVTPLDEAANEQVFGKLADQKMVPLDQVPDQTAAVRAVVAEEQMKTASAPPLENPASDAARLARLRDPVEFKAYFAAHPEKVGEFTRTLGNMRQAMFLTPELAADNQFAAKFDYTVNRGTMGLANMARVMENAGRLQTGTLNQFILMQEQNPLHESQIRNLARLALVAQDPRVFGELGQVGRYETVDQYTRRIATLATALNKERVLVTLFTGRPYLQAA